VRKDQEIRSRDMTEKSYDQGTEGTVRDSKKKNRRKRDET
jgi:hypothetical protein